MQRCVRCSRDKQFLNKKSNCSIKTLEFRGWQAGKRTVKFQIIVFAADYWQAANYTIVWLGKVSVPLSVKKKYVDFSIKKVFLFSDKKNTNSHI